MAVLRYNDIKKMDRKARDARLKELKMELIKSSVKAQGKNSKSKEIKKAIARVITFNRAEKGRELNK